MDVSDLKNRFKFHPADAVKAKRHETVRDACFELSLELDSLVPEGREKLLAITHLEEVMMWANAGIARQPKD
jgi:hypothetical protein